MTRMTRSSWRKASLFGAVAITAVLFALTALATAQGGWERGDEWRGQYKVGEQVELKINDTMWQKCKMVGNSPASAMRLECEEYVEPPPGTYSRAGGIYTNTSKSDIRPFKKETAAKSNANPRGEVADGARGQTQPDSQEGGLERPDSGECAFNEPPGAVTRSARPSEQLFKRVIFERYRGMESGRKVGVTFQTFRLATSFVNRISGGTLMHDGAPLGATVYRYKTDYFTCVKYTDSILRMEVKEGYFACFKDKSGEWACAEDGRRSWDQKHLPVK